MVSFNINRRIKYTKENVENIALDFMNLLIEKGVAQDVAVYFNGMRYSSVGTAPAPGKLERTFQFYRDYNDSNSTAVMAHNAGEYNPNYYFDHVAEKHILSASFEGPLYDVMNNIYGGEAQWVYDFFNRWGLTVEMGDSWNFSVYPIDRPGNSIEFWEYVDYSYCQSEAEPEPEIIYLRNSESHPDIPEIDLLMKYWYTLSKATGDIGGCVLGAKLTFDYKGNHYYMWPCSPWQGEGSWTPHVSEIVQILEKLGATNVNWNCGYLD